MVAKALACDYWKAYTTKGNITVVRLIWCIRIRKVRAHTGVRGNEVADLLAKFACINSDAMREATLIHDTLAIRENKRMGKYPQRF
jgi:hypothetical protein